MPSVIALQGYTLREFAKTPLDIARTLARIKKIGYDAIQVSGFAPIDPRELAKMFDGEGLICCATHIPFERLLAESQRVAEEHAIIKCHHTAPGSIPVHYRNEGAAGYLRFALEANLLALKLKPLGLTLSYHNHDFEFARFDGQTALDLIYSTALALCAEIDTYWVQAGGADPALWIRKMQGRSPLLHLKDMVYLGDKSVMAEVGEGNLNWPAILQAASFAQVQWYIVEQDTCQRDPFESIAISLANLRHMGLA
jgi:sugar phosphate isomerase/epimerase